MGLIAMHVVILVASLLIWKRLLSFYKAFRTSGTDAHRYWLDKAPAAEQTVRYLVPVLMIILNLVMVFNVLSILLLAFKPTT